MNFDAIGDTLRAHFLTQLAISESSVDVVLENAPTETVKKDPLNDLWVRFNWRPVEDYAASLGGLLYRGIGLVDVQIFTPLGIGTGVAERIGRSIQLIFRPQTVAPILADGIDIGRISFNPVGETNGWYQSQVRVQVRSQETL